VLALLAVLAAGATGDVVTSLDEDRGGWCEQSSKIVSSSCELYGADSAACKDSMQHHAHRNCAAPANLGEGNPIAAAFAQVIVKKHSCASALARMTRKVKRLSRGCGKKFSKTRAGKKLAWEGRAMKRLRKAGKAMKRQLKRGKAKGKKLGKKLKKAAKKAKQEKKQLKKEKKQLKKTAKKAKKAKRQAKAAKKSAKAAKKSAKAAKKSLKKEIKKEGKLVSKAAKKAAKASKSNLGAFLKKSDAKLKVLQAKYTKKFGPLPKPTNNWKGKPLKAVVKLAGDKLKKYQAEFKKLKKGGKIEVTAEALGAPLRN